MFQNYCKTALRNLIKNKVFSFINIAGLSLGLACSMLILLYAKDEWSFDRFHKKTERLYQLTCDRVDQEGNREKFAIAAMVQGPAFKEAIPEIDAFVRINPKQLVVKKDNHAMNENITWVDENFFSVFSFNLISGDIKSVLSGLHSMVLTESTARKYFGSENVLGKTLALEINGRFDPFIVSGIATDPPQNSSIQFTLLLPFKYLEQTSPDNGWMWVSYPTYFLLHPGSNASGVKAKMAKVYGTAASMEIDMNHAAGYNDVFIWNLAPFVQMHLNTEYKGVPEASNPMYSYVLTGVAMFILLIASINFVNLTLAASLKRIKEIGIRKVIGGSRVQLMVQFLGESVLLCLFSFLLALILAQLSIPFFNELANKKLSLTYLFDFQLLGAMCLLFMITGLSAGFYPALILSRLNPVQTIYNRKTLSGKNYLTKGLVVVQFSLATFLIVSTFFMNAQFSFLTRADLGYHDKNLLEFKEEKAVMNKPLTELLKKEMLKVAGVESVGYCNIGSFGGKTRAGGKEFTAVYQRVDVNFLTTLEATLAAGRNFSPDFPSDSINAVLINETFAIRAGWKEAVGRNVDYLNLPGWGNRKIIVIGVVKDYHFESLKEKIKPQLFTMDHHLPLGNFLIRLNPNHISSTLIEIGKAYRTLIPDHPFQYYFKEDQNLRNYAAESKWKQFMSFGAILTIFISCIGLFGLAMLSTEKRAKEISIRKILGGSTQQMVKMIFMDFIPLVFIAFLIAVPVGWFTVYRWLQNFAYRVSMSWWVFGIAGMLVVTIAILTTGYHAIRASWRSPVYVLRSD